MLRNRIVFASVAVAACLATGVAAQTKEASSPMKTFVLLFRQQSAQLSPADLERRAVEVRAWALDQMNQGRRRTPAFVTVS